MNDKAKPLVNLLIVGAIVSTLVGMAIKIGIMPHFGNTMFLFYPSSFLRFANTCLLLAIALSMCKLAYSK